MRSRRIGLEVLFYLLLAALYVKVSAEEWSVGKLEKEANLNVSDYLAAYGYTRYYTQNKKDIKAGLAVLQSFAGLKVTGSLDMPTVKLLKTPRCGKKDPVRAVGRRFRRFNVQGTKWKHNELTWHLEDITKSKNYRYRNLRVGDVRNVLRRAMKIWEKYINIKFIEKTPQDKVDVIIKFGSRNHGDPFPFDGAEGTLAHAFYPLGNEGLAGDVHFDDDEYFTIGDASGRGKDLMWVATHELGHSLGLDHSSDKKAVMFPYYYGYRKNLDLEYDDVIGVQSIYGGKIPETLPECPQHRITAVWFSERADRYIFVTKNKVYTMTRDGVLTVPEDVKKKYPKITGHITGAFLSKHVRGDNAEYVVLFTDREEYHLIYRDVHYISGPHKIKGGDYKNPLKLEFPAWVRLDAVMRFVRNNKVYFFTKEWYWRYDDKEKSMDKGYPRNIANNWKGLPAEVDAAFSSPNPRRTFFLANNKMYELDEEVVRVKPEYPKSIEKYWLKCESKG